MMNTNLLAFFSQFFGVNHYFVVSPFYAKWTFYIFTENCVFSWNCSIKMHTLNCRLILLAKASAAFINLCFTIQFVKRLLSISKWTAVTLWKIFAIFVNFSSSGRRIFYKKTFTIGQKLFFYSVINTRLNARWRYASVPHNST